MKPDESGPGDPHRGFRVLYRSAEADAALDRMGGLGPLLARAAGEPVTDHRTSWVRRFANGSGFFAKCYVYSTTRDRLRGALRTTFLAASRAASEAAALRWLRAHGFPAPAPWLVAERRRMGWLHAAVLVTEAFPGRPLAAVLPDLAAPARDRLLAALTGLVRDLHRKGFRDRNLDLRNLLLADGWDGSGTPQLAKIDSPRFRLRPPGEARDALTAADWQRLHRSCAALDLTLPEPG